MAEYDIQVFTYEGKFLRMFGRQGKGQGGLIRAVGVAVDGSGLVYVSEEGNQCVSVYTSEGVFVTSFSKRGSGPGEFNCPIGLVMDVVYVCDSHNNRAQLFYCGVLFYLSTCLLAKAKLLASQQLVPPHHLTPCCACVHR